MKQDRLLTRAAQYDPRDLPDEPPPFLGTWRRVYIFVIGYLAFIIAAFYAFSRAFAP